MTGTHFTNPDGYHDNDHYTCLRDLVTIAKLSLENTSVTEYGPQVEVAITPVRGGDKQWKNLNLLVDEDSQYYCPYAIGLKTGYTGAAGSCLMAAFERDGEWILMGIFGSETKSTRFSDAIALWEAYE
jgi:D-alanyl-D-alanine carboxypeptidase (penicillin-binding protein 5/6)